jgi:hypothetical protein
VLRCLRDHLGFDLFGFLTKDTAIDLVPFFVDVESITTSGSVMAVRARCSGDVLDVVNGEVVVLPVTYDMKETDPS